MQQFLKVIDELEMFDHRPSVLVEDRCPHFNPFFLAMNDFPPHQPVFSVSGSWLPIGITSGV